MAKPDILILDEPSTGLDPLMREIFVDILIEAKQRGATIFMSSHVFEEVEKTCDHVALLHNGKVVDIVDMKKIRHNELKTYKIGFEDTISYQKYVNENKYLTTKNDKYLQATVDIKDEQINKFMEELSKYKVKYIKEVKYTLKKNFLKKISEDNKND
jgi:ABC-2 type transport system ATP-binding protein